MLSTLERMNAAGHVRCTRELGVVVRRVGADGGRLSLDPLPHDFVRIDAYLTKVFS
jgi:hypothetical protein